MGRSIEFGLVYIPVLLLPFLSVIAESSKIGLSLSWNGGAMEIGDYGPNFQNSVRSLDSARKPHLRLNHSDVRAPTTQVSKAPPSASETIAALNTFAMRTTVPASDASRSGAGSTAGDND